MLVERLFASWSERAKGATPDIARRFTRRFHELRENSEGRLFPGAVRTIEDLRARGILLALVTNGHADTQREKVERFGLARLFDHVQIEGEVGIGKPEERAYRLAMETLGVSARETWIVGDHLAWEVAAPQRLGIFAVWHDHEGKGLPPGCKVLPDLKVTRIHELIEWLFPIETEKKYPLSNQTDEECAGKFYVVPGPTAMPIFTSSLVTIYSSDIARAVHFYGKILGLAETYRFPYQGEPEHVEFRVGSMTVAVSSPEGLASHGMPPPTPGHSFEIGLKTDDVDSLIEELREKGVTILREPFSSPAGNRTAYIADPDGTWISVYHKLPK